MEIGASICSKEVVATVASSLVPLALHLSSSIGCLGRRLRSPTRIQKHCLVVPHKGGKSYLHDKLQSQRSVLVVDVDEHIRLGCEAGKVLKMEKVPRCSQPTKGRFVRGPAAVPKPIDLKPTSLR